MTFLDVYIKFMKFMGWHYLGFFGVAMNIAVLLCAGFVIVYSLRIIIHDLLFIILGRIHEKSHHH